MSSPYPYCILAYWLTWTVNYGGCSDRNPPVTIDVSVPKSVSVELPCLIGYRLSGHPSFERGWWELNSQDNVVKKDSSGTVNSSEGYGITDEFSLIVNKTEPGKWLYKCTVMNDTALDNLRQQLTTLVVTDDVTEVINRSSGNDVTLHCPADKGSLATWYKGMSIPRKTVAASAPSPGSEFTIPSASESDSGIYVCDVIAENHGQVKRKLLYFAVSVTEAEGDGLQLSLIVSTAVILCVVLAVGVICYRRRKTRNTGRDDTSIRYQSSVSQTPDVCQYVKVGSNISPDESVVMETG